MDLSYAGRRGVAGHQGRKGNESPVNGGGSISRPRGKWEDAGSWELPPRLGKYSC